MRVLDEAGSPASANLPSLFRATPEAFLRRSGGRETFRWKAPTGESFIVKRMPGSGGRREHENLEALLADGLPVPRPVAWGQEGSRALFGGPVRSLVVMEDIEHEGTLRDRIDPERSAELLQIVARLHGRGWHHRDLYLQHFLVAKNLVLIDVGRARRDPRARRRWYVKDLAALRHSCPPGVGAREQLRFLSRYLDLRGVRDRKERSGWARAIVAKAAAMARHVPRDERAG